MSDDRRREPFYDDLCRSASFTLLRAEPDSDGDGLTIEGYGAVFNSVTYIDSWEGQFEEVIAPGAFKKSLRERTPKMQFDHGRHPLLGSLPLGRWTTAEEDTRGLRLAGRLTDNWLVLPFREAIRDGGVEGMSFRFSVERDEWVDKDGKKIREDELYDMFWRGPGDRGPIRRTLKEVKVSEAGPVVWPAYEGTEVGVRSQPPVVTIDLAHIGTPQARRDLARAVVFADAAARDQQAPDVEPDPEILADEPDTQTPDDESGATPEPQTTDCSAGEHPSPDAPPSTDQSAGEHSSTEGPANPADRAARIRAGARRATDRYLQVSTMTQTEKEGSR